jgi:hypothetical protein
MRGCVHHEGRFAGKITQEGFLRVAAEKALLQERVLKIARCMEVVKRIVALKGLEVFKDDPLRKAC